MSVIHNDLLLSTDEATGYNLTKSLRFRGAANAYLNRTPASAGNRQTWTWSGWVKKANYPNGQAIFSAGTDVNAIYIEGGGDGTIGIDGIYDGTRVLRYTTAAFRDISAWYHVVVVVDTTQATDTNRLKLYVNGVQISLATAVVGTYPAQNSSGGINNNLAHSIGRRQHTADYYFDGYLTETNFIDGQALTPSSFGETDTTTGVWKPKRYTGTYGTNGFYLPFTDVATTSGSNAGLGKDFSGNGNYWTTNNISVTAGATYDSMTDVPTLTSATAANYAVLNPLRPNGSASLVNGNLGVTPSGTYCNGLSTIQLDSGAYYAECTVTTAQAMAWGIWLNSASTAASTGTTPTGFYGIYSGGATLMINGTTPYTNAGASPSNGDIVQVAWSNGKVWFGKNNTWYDSTFGTTGNPSAGTNATVSSLSNDAFSVAFCGANASPVLAANFGQQAFIYTPPTGFKALNTYNLPDSTIVAGNKVMDATLYTGNGYPTAGTQSITNSGSIKPDFVWIKERGNVGNHTLTDSVRGTNSQLFSNQTAAQETVTDAVTSFNTNGFSLGSNTQGTLPFVNANTRSFVAWQWQAGQGTTSSNTNGSITSTVSVNATAGFSIVSWTATGSVATVGHGLGVKPSIIITKQRSTSGDWAFLTDILTGTPQYLYLNTTQAIANTGWGTNPTSSVFSGYSYPNGQTIVSYCWSEIAGFSKFGSYTGNGATDGTFVYTGFKPKFLLFKQSSADGEYWHMMDSIRSPTNAVALDLYPNLSNAEATYSPAPVDFLSNGFKFRTSNGAWNGSGATYIYMAFAENPFKNSLAR
jgi:hypothetical protein